MKSIFSICRIFTLCFFVVCIFSACSSTLFYKGKEEPKHVTIFITGYNTGNGDLTMIDDAQNTAVDFPAVPGQHIRWKLSDPRNHKIDSITAKPSNQNLVFKKMPHKVFLSKSWKGTLQDSSNVHNLTNTKDSLGNVEYIYKIIWEPAGPLHPFDPRIQIR
jgi:hypothetical protein